MFYTGLYSFVVKSSDLNATQAKIPVVIRREPFDTALGKVQEKTAEFKLTLELVHKLKSLSETQSSADNESAVKIEDAYKKGLHKDPAFLILGLRSLLHREMGIIKFDIRFTVIE